jgi:predicted nucleic-acid-binding Zn-ribbon protein
MSEVKKCPKCGGEMKSGEISGGGYGFRIRKEGDLSGDMINSFYCRDCGFVELYKEPSTKEPWRWPKEQQEISKVEPQQPEKEQPLPEAKKKLVR